MGNTSNITVDGSNFTINAPHYVGAYKIGTSAYCIKFMLDKKPNWFHRMMMKFCLGWVWEDLDDYG